MTDERIVEVIARWLRSRDGRDFGSLDAFKPAAELALAALRDAGFDIYRPDECEEAEIETCQHDHPGCRYLEHYPFSAPGTYRLVQVGGDS